MANILADRVKETTTTTGTGTYALGGASIGYQTFLSAIGNGNTCYYCVTNGTDWEVGLGTVSSSNLVRTTIHASSNANAAVNWIAGVKTIFTTLTADWAKSLPSKFNVTTKTSTYTAVNNDIILCDASGGAFTINLPAAASNTNSYVVVKKIDASANAITIDGNASETIDGALTVSVGTQYQSFTMACDGSNWFIV